MVHGSAIPEPVDVLVMFPLVRSLKVIGRGVATGRTFDSCLAPAQIARFSMSPDSYHPTTTPARIALGSRPNP
jgi:hypothetical protein